MGFSNPTIMSFEVRSEKFDTIALPSGSFANMLIPYQGRLACVTNTMKNDVNGGIILWTLDDAEKHIWSCKLFLAPFAHMVIIVCMYVLLSHNSNKDYTFCKIYLTPQATKKKKEVEEEKQKQKKGEAVVSVADVEALEEQQPCNVEYHQPLAPLDSCQPQRHDLEYQQQQFCPGPLDSYQPHPHDMESQQPHNPLL
ncbi:F-box associated domain type 3 [Arabidopsis suecica]|uniref:F-box associated domain type 3 n=1 Tax=Arabidopsis suecica TaxID=45249 RepID=A0A8T2DL92_ARASU|nr:F-box associated domain type 3 [Arabidopsis suecica]